MEAAVDKHLFNTFNLGFHNKPRLHYHLADQLGRQEYCMEVGREVNQENNILMGS